MIGFDENGLCTIHCPWKGASRADVDVWAQRMHGCDAETWARTYEQRARDDACDTRRMMYPTAAELIADEGGAA